MNNQKVQLRREIREKKKEYSENILSELSSNLLKQLEESSHFIQSQKILLYYSLPDEVNTHHFIDKWSQSKDIILPAVDGDNLILKHYQGRDDLRYGAFHILEPCGKEVTRIDDIELAIIPGMSFDNKGHRLGRGKGYYDRLLPQLNTYNIGICFNFQLSEKVPSESFDIIMDEVWTEKGKIF